MRKKDDELHQRMIGRPFQTKRARDIGDGQAEYRDANEPSRPDFDRGGGLRGRREKARPGRRTAHEHPYDAHRRPAEHIRVDQGEDRDPRDRVGANAGCEEGVARRGESRNRRELQNQTRHGVRGPAEGRAQPLHAPDGHGLSAIGVEYRAGLAPFVVRRTGFQRGEGPAKPKPDKAARPGARGRRRSILAKGSRAAEPAHRDRLRSLSANAKTRGTLSPRGRCAQTEPTGLPFRLKPPAAAPPRIRRR